MRGSAAGDDFDAAVAMGYRYLETDVQVTSDGVLLAFHDSSLDRLTDRVGRICQLILDEVDRMLEKAKKVTSQLAKRAGAASLLTLSCSVARSMGRVASRAAT